MRHRRLTAVLLALAALVATAPIATVAQNTSNAVPPIIDVHVHAMDESGPSADA
jgi:Spy/CpxP family protein refolding chaperone